MSFNPKVTSITATESQSLSSIPTRESSLSRSMDRSINRLASESTPTRSTSSSSSSSSSSLTSERVRIIKNDFIEMISDEGFAKLAKLFLNYIKKDKPVEQSDIDSVINLINRCIEPEFLSEFRNSQGVQLMDYEIFDVYTRIISDEEINSSDKTLMKQIILDIINAPEFKEEFLKIPLPPQAIITTATVALRGAAKIGAIKTIVSTSLNLIKTWISLLEQTPTNSEQTQEQRAQDKKNIEEIMGLGSKFAVKALGNHKSSSKKLVNLAASSLDRLHTLQSFAKGDILEEEISENIDILIEHFCTFVSKFKQEINENQVSDKFSKNIEHRILAASRQAVFSLPPQKSTNDDQVEIVPVFTPLVQLMNQLNDELDQEQQVRETAEAAKKEKKSKSSKKEKSASKAPKASETQASTSTSTSSEPKKKKGWFGKK